MEIKLDSRVYPLEAILNASYVFIDRAYIFLDTDAKGAQIRVSFKAKHRLSDKGFESLRGEFMNELLYSSLRYTISKNNKKIREYIIGRALCSALPASDQDLPEDPLGIAIPWEEKYGKHKKNAKSKV